MPAPLDDPLLTVREIADLLKLNPQTIYNWIDQGSLPAVRLGPRRVRVHRSALDQLLGKSSASKPAEAQIPAERTRLESALKGAAEAIGSSPAELASALRELAEAASELARRLEP